jgi:hypothetical protein
VVVWVNSGMISHTNMPSHPTMSLLWLFWLTAMCGCVPGTDGGLRVEGRIVDEQEAPLREVTVNSWAGRDILLPR